MSRRAAGLDGPEPITSFDGAPPMTGLQEDPGPLVADRRPAREAATGPVRTAATGPMAAAAPPPEARAARRWRKGADVDQELWPIETFGGVSDEQFWDDLAADKPLATRTAQADPGSSRQPAQAYAPPRIATQPVRAAQEPAESRGRRSAEARGQGADEDPLTSPAYSLRAKGAVDGHSYQSSSRSRDLGSDRYRADPLRSDGYWPGSSGTTGARGYPPGSGSADRYGGTAAYPQPGQPRSQPAPVMNTPSYGDSYGYRNPVSQAGDPRRANGTWGEAGPGGNGTGDRNWGPRHAYPPANGYRGPQDPWGNGRR